MVKKVFYVLSIPFIAIPALATPLSNRNHDFMNRIMIAAFIAQKNINFILMVVKPRWWPHHQWIYRLSLAAQIDKGDKS